jgi:hypothetical protein
MTGLIEKAWNSVVDVLFGKPKAVKLGPPGQGTAARKESDDEGTGAPEREWELPDVQYNPDGTYEVRPDYGSWDKIE